MPTKRTKSPSIKRINSNKVVLKRRVLFTTQPEVVLNENEEITGLGEPSVDELLMIRLAKSKSPRREVDNSNADPEYISNPDRTPTDERFLELGKKSLSEEDLAIARLFDPVGAAQLSTMFCPKNGEKNNEKTWLNYAARAGRNGLIVARTSRAMFNPYLAACWWISKKKPLGWTLNRCLQVLGDNLPPRSRCSIDLLGIL